MNEQTAAPLFTNGQAVKVKAHGVIAPYAQQAFADSDFEGVVVARDHGQRTQRLMCWVRPKNDDSGLRALFFDDELEAIPPPPNVAAQTAALDTAIQTLLDIASLQPTQPQPEQYARGEDYRVALATWEIGEMARAALTFAQLASQEDDGEADEQPTARMAAVE